MEVMNKAFRNQRKHGLVKHITHEAFQKLPRAAIQQLLAKSSILITDLPEEKENNSIMNENTMSVLSFFYPPSTSLITITQTRSMTGIVPPLVGSDGSDEINFGFSELKTILTAGDIDFSFMCWGLR